MASRHIYTLAGEYEPHANWLVSFIKSGFIEIAFTTVVAIWWCDDFGLCRTFGPRCQLYSTTPTELTYEGLDTSTAIVRLTCLTDDSQYANTWNFEPFPLLGLEPLGYFVVKENSLHLRMVCLIDCDLGGGLELPTPWLGEYKYSKRLSGYDTGVVRQDQMSTEQWWAAMYASDVVKPNSLYGEGCVLI